MVWTFHQYLLFLISLPTCGAKEKEMMGPERCQQSNIKKMKPNTLSRIVCVYYMYVFLKKRCNLEHDYIFTCTQCETGAHRDSSSGGLGGEEGRRNSMDFRVRQTWIHTPDLLLFILCPWRNVLKCFSALHCVKQKPQRIAGEKRPMCELMQTVWQGSRHMVGIINAGFAPFPLVIQ